MAAPDQFHDEVDAVVRKHAARDRLTPKEGAASAEQFLAEPVRISISKDLLRRAYELATRFNCPTAYDSQYLAVAERLGREFWAADPRFFNTLPPDRTWVKWVGGFSPQ